MGEEGCGLRTTEQGIQVDYKLAAPQNQQFSELSTVPGMD